MSDTMTDEIRAKIRETKAALSQSGNDVAAAFAQVDALIEDEIQTIEQRCAMASRPCLSATLAILPLAALMMT